MPIPSRTSLKTVGAVLAILVAGAPAMLFDVWLKKQGRDETAVTLSWALESAETRIGQAIEALRGLSERGIDSCRPGHIAAMRQTALLNGPIKQILLSGPAGEILCTDTGEPAASHEVLTSAAGGSPDIALDVVRLTDRSERFLRIRKPGQTGEPGLAALVPASLLLPQTSTQGGRLQPYARIAMSDGTPVGTSGAAPDPATPDGQFIGVLPSKRFPLTITVSMPRGSAIANYDDVRRIGMMFSGGIALAVLLFAVLFFRRRPIDPMAAMKKAILNDEFVPYYQPIVDLQTGKLLGAEVLVRWRQRDGSLLEPNAFVLLLESSGLVLDFTRKLMRRVKKEIGEAIAQRPTTTIAFNVAPQHFEDAMILNDVATIFEGSGIRLTQLVLELTERNKVTNLTSMRRTVAALQRVGCKVAIDDVGTGHSGLSYILKLGVDIIKIDRMFVEAIGSEGHSKAIIETLIDLAKNMRMDIVAEGVETFDQVTYLRERGIAAAQGFVFAPPLPASTFVQLLEAMDPVPAATVRDGGRSTRSAVGGVATVARRLTRR